MLFGQWEDENDRQKKAIKTKMYKEMLDNQLLINQRYKQKHTSNKDRSQIIQKNDRKNKKELDLFIPDIKKKDKNINLPSIKDKNTYYQGSSKFIKVQDAPKPTKQGHIKTELVEQEEDQLDEYNNTCQKIIRELKSINKQTPKMKIRRKLYQYSELAPNKKRYQKNRVEQVKKSQVQIYNNYDYLANKKIRNEENSFQSISMKAKNSFQDRAPSFNLIKPFKQTKLQQATKPRREKTEPQRPMISTSQRSKPKQSSKIIPINQFQESQQNDQSQKAKSKYQQIVKLKDTSSPNKPTNPEKNRVSSFVQTNKYQSKMAQSQKQPYKANESELKLHKQNFLDLLRKVKNRGQSLYIKLSALPLTKNQARK